MTVVTLSIVPHTCGWKINSYPTFVMPSPEYCAVLGEKHYHVPEGTASTAIITTGTPVTASGVNAFGTVGMTTTLERR